MKLVLHLAARGGVGSAFDAALEAERVRLVAAAPNARVTQLRQIENDSFALATPSMRYFQGTLDVASDALDARALERLAAGIALRVEPVAHTDLCAALIGRDHVIIPCAPAPVRYQYLMRRKAGTTREQYFDHYFNKHSKFGLITPGIDGYVQFHVDAAASQLAAAAAGFGTWKIDSISELHMQSHDGFVEALGKDSPAHAALADEDLFVDRANSVSFTSAVIWRSPER
jgi:hypothetical protein